MPNTITKIDIFPLRYHVTYWIGSVVLWTLFVLMTDGIILEPFVNKLCYLPSQMLATYAFLYFLIPYIFEGSWIKFIAVITTVSYIASVLARITKIYIYEPVLGFDGPQESIYEILTQTSKLMTQYMLWVYLTPVITSLIVLVIIHLREKTRLEELKKEKNIAELKFLKAQVHPHFLFNTLNNLYSMALTNSPKTAETTSQLSSILRYMFYKCNQPSVTMADEITLLNNYIDLEKIRYSERLQVTFKHNVVDENYKIAPLVLLSVVENAFKHGASSDLDQPKIKINLNQIKNRIEFEVYNTKPAKISSDENSYRKGIGMTNVTRQLQLVYPEQHTLNIENGFYDYRVNIIISPNIKYIAT